KFKKQCTFALYIVSPDYAIRDNKEPCVFTLNTEAILNTGAKIYFSNAKKIEGNTYTSTGNSRLFAIVTKGTTLEEAKEKAYSAIKGNIDDKLDYRTDIGTIYKH
ncbi:MAG: hypothetical protein FWC68_06285, partial [Oscillospiraceae bacterium]|nr:hypothetical protein [Oscillospiraceae bacterium]